MGQGTAPRRGIHADQIRRRPDRTGREWERYTYDLVYFDAFAPATQPEMWTADIFRRIFRILAPGGALVTYSARGTVKQALREAGFTVRRLPGAPGKHHMLRAEKPVEPPAGHPAE